MNTNDTNEMSLSISREIYDEVTDIPHFIFTLRYFGHFIYFDDIYFDDLNSFLKNLNLFNENRTTSVRLDGGDRCNIIINGTNSGGGLFSFIFHQSQPFFPGECRLEGSFLIDGDMISQFTRSLEKLVLKGEPFFIDSKSLI